MPLPDSVYGLWSASATLQPVGGWILGTYVAADSTRDISLQNAPRGSNLNVSAHAVNSGGVGTSDTLSITTMAGVETVSASNITIDGATLEACFSFSDAIDSLGFILSTQADLSS